MAAARRLSVAQRSAGALALALALAAGCRKPPPAEIVLTPDALGDAVTGPRRPPELPPAPSPPAPSPLEPPPPEPPPPGGAGGVGRSDSPPGAEEACGGFDFSPRAFSRRELLASVADCAFLHYCDFAASVEPLVAATATLATDPGNDSNRALAQAAFRTAVASWQRAEAFRFGPAARSSEPAGRDLRDAIYAWPLRSECKVDEQLVSRAYASPEFAGLDFRLSPLTGRSLTAVEYLLFNAGPSNACSAFSEINASGSWAALGDAERHARRASYAAAAARDIQARSEDLLAAFRGPSGFRAQLLSAGAAGSPFPTEQAALNAVSDALFYLDLEVKDFKLARPLGLTPDCTAATCPSEVEAAHARLSSENLKQNLLGFQRSFAGCGADPGALGFDDWLRDMGASDLADRMLANIAAARGAADSLSAPLEELLSSDPESVRAVHAAVKAVTDLLKTEFVTVLNLELPAATEGDND